MNARQTNFVLGAFVAGLLILNCITTLVLLRQRSEIQTLRDQPRQQGRVMRERERRVETAAAEELASLAATQSVSIVLGEVNQENGLQQVFDMKDGITMPTTIDGVACRELARPGEMAKIHFTVDSSFKKATPMHAWVEVEYFDAAANSVLCIEYDGPRAYTPSERRVRLKNTSEWKTNIFELTDATFSGRENGGADFRIIATKPKVFVRRVTLKME